MIGQVKFFNYEKGFGFIAGEDGNDYFAHAKEIKDQTSDENGKKNLGSGWDVQFDIGTNDKGTCAINIRTVY